jgi:hypothetical protein
MTDQAAFWAQDLDRDPALSVGVTAPHTALIRDRVLEVVRGADRNAERSLQVQAGPSEIGAECERRLAYKATGFLAVNHAKDSWAAIVGTGIHAWMERAFTAFDANSGRFLIETRVSIPSTDEYEGTGGTCDLYDRKHGEVIDFKSTSQRQLKKYAKSGPSAGYKAQLHVYGLGMRLRGETPRRVANIFFPRDGDLEDTVAWSEPYNEKVAVDALVRFTKIAKLARALVALPSPDPEASGPNYDALVAIPTTPSPLCGWCPAFKPDAPSLRFGCPGNQSSP